MKTQFLLILQGSLLLSGTAAMAIAERGAEANELTERTVGGVYICDGYNWSGNCGYKVQPINTCIVLASPWVNSISSFGPDHGTHCYVFDNPTCSGQPSDLGDGPYCVYGSKLVCDNVFRSPGVADLRNSNPDGTDWDNRIQSWICLTPED